MLLVWLALFALAAAPAAASTRLEPASGPAGAEPAVRVAGLEPYEVVELRVAGRLAELSVADGRGRVSTTAPIPDAARGSVPVALETEDGRRSVLTYRVAHRFGGTRAREAADWRGRVMRVTTDLEYGRLLTRVELSGLHRAADVVVRHRGRRVARASARGGRRTVNLRLPGWAAERPLRARGTGVDLVVRLPTPPAVLVAVGDIACRPGAPRTATRCREADTAALADRYRADAAALLGDIQYEDARLDEFKRSFDRTWGQLSMPLRPVPGNHEYRVEGARDYFEYFELQAGWRPPSWYAYNLGNWHLVALNSNCDREGVRCDAGSVQERWLRAELAASRHRCTLAYWHHPRYSSGFHGSSAITIPFWQALHEDLADIVLTGHDHDYERFAPQDAFGQADETGPRSFVVGTGGKDVTALREPGAPHSQFGLDTVHGVMIFRLYETEYSWRYVSVDGEVLDFGNGTCL